MSCFLSIKPKIKESGSVLTIEQLNYLVESNDKKRFIFNENHTKIRAPSNPCDCS